MNKIYRLKNKREFDVVYKNGKSYWNRNLILYVNKNSLDYNRIGYSITKKVGNSVVRNKIRRRMKEIYRLNLDDMDVGYDFILIPKKNTAEIPYEQLESAMLHIFKISKILKK